jgi:hypothetical protein
MIASYRLIKPNLYEVNTAIETINIHMGEHGITIFKMNEEPRFFNRLNQSIHEVVKLAISSFIEVEYEVRDE